MPSTPIELLQHLIRIPSVNPDEDAAPQGAGELRLAQSIAAWLEGPDCRVLLEEIKPGRPNLIARFAPMDGRPRILFGPHLDTVGVNQMTIDPFSGELVDNCGGGRPPLNFNILPAFCVSNRSVQIPIGPNAGGANAK